MNRTNGGEIKVMFETITVPFWLLILLLVFSVWSMLDRLFVPSLRWLVRRRINRVIDEIGSRLDIGIRPFQLTKRQVLIDRLVYDPKVIDAIGHFSQKDNKPREVVQSEVAGYAREIVPAFNAYLYFRVGYWIAKKVARFMYQVRVGRVDNEVLAAIPPESTVVFVMNHRSNMDYILVAFLAAERTTLSYAVGEWARIWPLQTLIRSMGAFFVRRSSGNPLYRLVLERYIHMATKEGVCQAVFPEGGLSRDGRLRTPKMGLVDYMLRSYRPGEDRDIVFVPVGINYERTLEDRSLLRSLEPELKRRSMFFIIRTILGFIGHHFILMVFGKWHRFGYACVNFGDPMSLEAFCRRADIDFRRMDRYARREKVERFSNELMAAIERIVPVLPMCLLSAVLIEHADDRLSSFDLKGEVYGLIKELQEARAPVYETQGEYENALDHALDMLRIRHLVIESDGLYRAHPDNLHVLQYYAHSMAYWTERRKDEGPTP